MVLSTVGPLLIASTAIAGANGAPCNSENREVTAKAEGDVVVLTRDACDDEKSVLLVYTIDKAPIREAPGKKSGSKWVFTIPDNVDEAAIVHLKFDVHKMLDASGKNNIQVQANTFRTNLVKAVRESFVEAEEATRGVPHHQRKAVIWSLFKTKLREQTRNLLQEQETELSKRFYEGKPVSEYALEQLGFRRLGPHEFEPGEQVLRVFKNAWDPAARANWNGQADISGYDANQSYHECLGKPGKLSGDDATAAAREGAVTRCLDHLVKAARKALPSPTPQQQLDLSTLEAKDASPVPKEPDPNRTTPFTLEYSTAITAVRNDTSKLHGNGSVIAQAAADAMAAADALQYAAALVFRDRIAVSGARENLIEELKIDINEITAQVTFVRQVRASEFLKVTPGKPRFFVSTGVVATSLSSGSFLDEPWKASLPILVSICLGTQGCETKGIGTGGSGWNYLSADIGVKTFFIGDRDAREDTPSFLLGVGVNLVYALHLSAGVNVFENAQTDQVNFGPYVGVTLDLVDGKDILGKLGIGEPKVEVLGQKSEERLE